MASGAERRGWLESWRCRQQIHRSLQGRHDRIAAIYRAQLPTFIIIGAAKSATTSLATALSRHPEIQISQSMEPKFFERQGLLITRINLTPIRGGSFGAKPTRSTPAPTAPSSERRY